MNLTATSEEAIIAACQNIVRKKGLSAVNMRSVAAECNVAVGSIYNYFPSKSDLLCAAIESIWIDIFHMPGSLPEFADFVDCLSWMYESMKVGGRKYPGFFSMHALSFASEDKVRGRRRMEEYFNHLKESLLEVLNKDIRIREGTFNEVLTPELFIEYILTLFFASLQDSQQTCDGLIEIVKRCLYRSVFDKS